MHAPTRDLFDERGQCLDSGVDGICSHRISSVVEQMDDQHRSKGCIGENPYLDIACPTLEGHDDRIGLIGQVQKPLLLTQQIKPGCPGVRQIQHLHLGDHHRFR